MSTETTTTATAAITIMEDQGTRVRGAAITAAARALGSVLEPALGNTPTSLVIDQQIGRSLERPPQRAKRAAGCWGRPAISLHRRQLPACRRASMRVALPLFLNST